MDLQEVRWRGLDRIDPAPYRDRWWAFVNTVMDIVSIKAGVFLD
jgi:hypothetical protein